MARSDIGLLLLHALPLDGRMWEDQRGVLPDHTFAPDLYGYGDSVHLWAAQCLTLMPTNRFVVVGCSVGGSCALEILRLAPERVAATVIIGTKARHDPDPAFAAKAFELIKSGGVASAWTQLWEPLFDPQHGDARNRAQAIALNQSAEDLMNGVAAFHSRASREDVVTDSKTPIHVVSGDRDRYPGVDYARRLAALNPLAKRHVIEGCGHYAPLERPDEISALIAGVIDQVSV